MKQKDQSQLKYRQIYNHFKDLILNGMLKQEERLPTESEICSQFGVSRITVTKALNLLVNEGMIYRIQGGGTFVSRQAPPGVAGDTEFISFVTSFNPIGREMDMIRGIEHVVRDSGYLLSISNTNEDPQAERQIIANIRDRARGIILYPSRSNQNTNLFYELVKEEYPIVFVDQYPFNVPCSYVVSDNRDGGRQVGEIFSDMGAKRIALIFHDVTEFSSELERYEGFIDAIGERGLSRDNVRMISIRGKDIDEDVSRILRQLLEGDEPVTHIFACNAVIARSVIEYIQESGLPIPPELVLACFDDINFQTNGIRTVVVRQNLYAIGEEAGKILLEKLRNPSFLGHRRKLPVEVIQQI